MGGRQAFLLYAPPHMPLSAISTPRYIKHTTSFRFSPFKPEVQQTSPSLLLVLITSLSLNFFLSHKCQPQTPIFYNTHLQTATICLCAPHSTDYRPAPLFKILAFTSLNQSIKRFNSYHDITHSSCRPSFIRNCSPSSPPSCLTYSLVKRKLLYFC